MSGRPRIVGALFQFVRRAALFSASASDLVQQALPEFVAKSLLSDRAKFQAEAELAKCQQNQVKIWLSASKIRLGF